jgi:hypothetical protein
MGSIRLAPQFVMSKIVQTIAHGKSTICNCNYSLHTTRPTEAA